MRRPRGAHHGAGDIGVGQHIGQAPPGDGAHTHRSGQGSPAPRPWRCRRGGSSGCAQGVPEVLGARRRRTWRLGWPMAERHAGQDPSSLPGGLGDERRRSGAGHCGRPSPRRSRASRVTWSTTAGSKLLTPGVAHQAAPLEPLQHGEHLVVQLGAHADGRGSCSGGRAGRPRFRRLRLDAGLDGRERSRGPRHAGRRGRSRPWWRRPTPSRLRRLERPPRAAARLASRPT